jgi:hypothetical protein
VSGLAELRGKKIRVHHEKTLNLFTKKKLKKPSISNKEIAKAGFPKKNAVPHKLQTRPSFFFFFYLYAIAIPLKH